MVKLKQRHKLKGRKRVNERAVEWLTHYSVAHPSEFRWGANTLHFKLDAAASLKSYRVRFPLSTGPRRRACGRRGDLTPAPRLAFSATPGMN